MNLGIIYTAILTTILFSQSIPGRGLVEEPFDTSEEEASQMHNAKTRPPTPLYIKHLLHQLSQRSSPAQGDIIQNVDQPFIAWLPTEIKEDSQGKRTIVEFQQDPENLGLFKSSQITLTILKQVEFVNETYVSVFAHWQNDTLQLQQGLVQSMPILPGKRFYDFDIKPFISACIAQYNAVTPFTIQLSFQVFSRQGNGQVVDFMRFFDVHVNRPLIVFMFYDFAPAKNELEFRPPKRRPRVTSQEGRPQTVCQRRERLATPNDVGWYTVVAPEIIDFGYCSGTCSFPLQDSYYNYTLHNFYMDRYRIKYGSSLPADFMLSGCKAIKYKPVTILEESEPNKLKATVKTDLVVDQCGCR